jgi:hypothetical protein
VGFQRVGGDAGIVAPDLLQQHIAAVTTLSLGTIEVLDDGRFLFGEADLAAALVDQEAASGPA